jgi:hypothetical protein
MEEASMPEDKDRLPPEEADERPNAPEEPTDPDYVRPAGPKQMKMPIRRWTKTDEEVDESFPASDPPGNY